MYSLMLIMTMTLGVVNNAPANHVVFSEVLISPNSNQDYFIEFYNPTSSTINLGNFQVQTPSESLLLPDGTNIAAYSFLLIAQVSDNWPSTWVQPDIWYDNLGISDNSGVRLVNTQNSKVDAVGWGLAPYGFYEGTPVVPPAIGKSIERKSGLIHNENAGNGRDTDNNFADFIVRNFPQPQNTQSPPEKPDAGTENYGWGVIKAIYAGS